MLEIKNVSQKDAREPVIDGVFNALPLRLCREINSLNIKDSIEEIRLRLCRRASLVAFGKNIMLDTILDKSEMVGILSGICKGSLYAFSETINKGYISLPDGVRVGVCGHAACEGNRIIGVHEVTSLSVRIPHRVRIFGDEICRLLSTLKGGGGILIYSPPGVGKTTLLRSLASQLASGNRPRRTAIIDTRGELSFALDGKDLCIDVLSGYPRREGIEIATRSLNAELIICDEIGDYEEAMALVASHNCGVPLIASAHASSINQLLSRSGIRLLHEASIFGAYVGIKRGANNAFEYDITLRKDCDNLF